QELKDSFDLNSVLNWGSLPKVQSLGSNAERAAYLKTYALTYLKEEVQSEQLVRKLEPFRLFLEVAAQCNAKILNFKKISNDVGVDDKTVFSYFQILEETWIGFFLPSYHPSIRKSQLSHPKFYFFDPGVIRALSRTLAGNIVSGTSLYGDAFEHWVILEIYRLNEYTGSDYRLSYFATKEGSEVDLVLDKPGFPVILIEIKSSTRVDEREVNKLARISKDFKNAKVYYVSQDMSHLKIGSVICLHWQELLKELFQEVNKHEY
ncbi:MAG: DUF4143 domain-containing protein, partial [Deltaproteobacteria bacterium]|nr:DUF4143 domain-containing protein [Deltaproteobacteria bacterium]